MPLENHEYGALFYFILFFAFLQRYRGYSKKQLAVQSERVINLRGKPTSFYQRVNLNSRMVVSV